MLDLYCRRHDLYCIRLLSRSRLKLPVGASLLAMAVCQSISIRLIQRYREQARSHMGKTVRVFPRCPPKAKWRRHPIAPVSSPWPRAVPGSQNSRAAGVVLHHRTDRLAASGYPVADTRIQECSG
ncbi:Hypothetical protein PSEBR_m606 [Pseudomonas brassicacearum subsp. brassicacearum NFM421]|uniref:Uncharacterized protein n=1 Tax=Pseudomonas brassicacearum (strain NFM421) TaxID=994484 RepID=F2K9S0_PSEBN|nr:Hypothetical protein PSEBR_m606 [Pseudomonas brassicacearum subsp. brassicacearum NFM421]